MTNVTIAANSEGQVQIQFEPNGAPLTELLRALSAVLIAVGKVIQANTQPRSPIVQAKTLPVEPN